MTTSFYTIPVMENNASGSLLNSVSAVDPDYQENKYLIYFIVEKEIVNTSGSMLFSVNPENGNLALKAFDYEREKEFLFHIEARDSRVTPVSTNVTFHIITVDQNDHTPVVVSPWMAQESEVDKVIPRDPCRQWLVVVSKDNANPVLSATVTIKVSTVEQVIKPFPEATEDVPLEYDLFFNIKLYLVIGVGSVSFLLLITILVIIVLKCQKQKPTKATPPCRNNIISQRNSTVQFVSGRNQKWKLTTGHVRYSIQEELQTGTTVGNVAKDLGFEASELADRNLRVVTGTKQELFQVNQGDGALFVNQRIDREELCGNTIPCYINLKAVIENPLEMHHITVEIVDVNDHAPSFPDKEYRLEIPELTMIGAKFQVEGAQDSDIGLNALRLYKLTQNDYFQLEITELSEDSKIPFITLKKSLDRELIPQYNMQLTAIDGGSPKKSGTLNITVVVLDANDNAPICGQQKYTVTIPENVPLGTVLMQVNASDADEGINGQVEYSFRSKFRNKASELFTLNPTTGEITVKDTIDFEKQKEYEINVQVSDRGLSPMVAYCNVFVKVEDVNDNVPEIDITSLSSQIPESAPIGTTVALMGVRDLDSGVNGQVVCTLPENLPFDLKPSSEGSYYSLVTKNSLDRELVAKYDIVIKAKDQGTPSLSSMKTVEVKLSDINDNSPVFLQSPYTLYLLENNDIGASIFTISAHDADENENARISYSLGNIFHGQ
ncbi:hypothetical protein Z043_107975, partial [Scleropages formosus]